MCPEACCGMPVSECTCGPDCEHCDCYEKNKAKNEGIEGMMPNTQVRGIMPKQRKPYHKHKIKSKHEPETDLSEAEEKSYVCVHAKKGKHECKATSSYGAAKKAAEHWGLKSTAGIDAHLADEKKTVTPQEFVTAVSEVPSKVSNFVKNEVEKTKEYQKNSWDNAKKKWPWNKIFKSDNNG